MNHEEKEEDLNGGGAEGAGGGRPSLERRDTELPAGGGIHQSPDYS